MVFSSVSPYPDHSNWQQQPPPPPPPLNHHHQQDHPHLPPPPQPHGVGSIRPGSMADRARLANIPMPEGPLKCPRCDSINTKFCYFNNYNLSQPRHFCKTCRRYWTRGGALRSVPVGGGCRRNKRSKGSSSKSSSASATAAVSAAVTTGLDILGLPNLRPMAPPLQSYLTDFSYGAAIPDPPLGMNYGGGGGNMERLRFTQMTSQFPFMGGSDVYPFEGTVDPPGFMSLPPPPSRQKPSSSSAAVKMEDHNNNNHLNLSSQFLGMMNPTSTDQSAWNGSGAWKMDLSNYGSSTSNNNPP